MKPLYPVENGSHSHTAEFFLKDIPFCFYLSPSRWYLDNCPKHTITPPY